MSKEFTGYYDDNNNPINVGDKLSSKWGYELIASKYDDGSGYYGKLVCDENNNCKDMPYSLNSDLTIIENE